MSISATPSERDLRTLAGIVSDHRADLPKDGLPLSLLAELMGQIRCDLIAFHGYDSERENTWFLQHLPGGEDVVVEEDWDALFWPLYWTASRAAIPTGPTTCEVSRKSRTSTRPGSGIPPACTTTSAGRGDGSTI